MRTKSPLSVQLAPGILSEIFDGIQRPLEVIAKLSDSIYIPRGIDVPPLDTTRMWEFTPSAELKKSTMLSGGDIYGTVYENNLFKFHRILLPPKAKGRIDYIAEKGMYNIDDVILCLEHDGKKTEFTMATWWPVRQARPVAEKLAGDTPLLTGQRVLDALFPSVLGGTCAIPGAFGCGKTCIS